MRPKHLSLSFFLLLLLSTAVRAQLSYDYSYPSAILVQLGAEQNKMRYLESQHNEKKIAQLKKDVAAIWSCTVRDFRHNFRICPVYFFVDTNLNLIKERKFQGILLGTDGKIAEKYVINEASTDYYIVNYGYPVAKMRHDERVKNDDPDAGSFDAHYGKAMVIYNYKYEQLSYKYLRLAPTMRDNSLKTKKYYYKSPVFDIGYHPIADKLYKVMGPRPE